LNPQPTPVIYTLSPSDSAQGASTSAVNAWPAAPAPVAVDRRSGSGRPRYRSL